jgi:hypothetical protein
MGKTMMADFNDSLLLQRFLLKSTEFERNVAILEKMERLKH